MKRKILGLAVVVLAISLSAFEGRPESKKFAQYYWFPLDNGTGQPQTVSHLVYQTFDPYLCFNWGWGDYCAGAFTSYTGTPGNYRADGIEVSIDYSLIF